MAQDNTNNSETHENQTFSGASSILDKIISSKEDQEKQEFNPTEVISQLSKKLTNKEADVLKRRFGLNDFEKETLEVIGKRYEVTRERIRQIENLAIKKIKEDEDFIELIKSVEQVLIRVITQHGGIVEEEYLLQQLFFSDHKNSDEKATLFILSELLNNRFTKVSADEKYRKAWRLPTVSMNFVDQATEELTKIISNVKVPQTLEDIIKLFEKNEFYQQNENKLDEKVIESFLELSQQIARNPFSEYGLKIWGSVMPRRMNDKIYTVLKKEGKPMHFVDIAGKISQIFKKKAYPPTVHNELILNDKYVLVGRGIYALKEWGYKEGIVADVLIDILKNSEPMTKKDLVNKVLEQRIVKKNTIYLALTNKKRFQKTAGGRYTLAPDK